MPKWSERAIWSLALSLSMLTCFSADAQELSLWRMEGLPANAAIDELVEQIKEDSNGELTITIEDQGSYGPILDQVISGTAQLALVPIDWSAAQLPAFDEFSLPFLFDDLAHVDAYIKMARPRSRMQELLGERQLVPLGFLHAGMRIIAAARPLRNLDDFQGVKLRVVDDASVEPFQILGLAPFRLSFAEVYTALQTGVADATETTLTFYEAARLSEVVPEVTLTRHRYIGSVLLGSSENVSDEALRTVLAAAEKVFPVYNVGIVRNEWRMDDRLARSGVRFARPEDEEIEGLRDQLDGYSRENGKTEEVEQDVEQARRRAADQVHVRPKTVECPPDPCWNVWLKDQNGKSRPEGPVRSGEAIELVIDLSAYSFERDTINVASSATAGAGLREAVQDATQLNAGKLELTIRPVLLGIDWQQNVPEQNRKSIPLVIDIGKLKADLDEQALEYAEDVRSLADFADAARANEPVTLKLKATSDGCALVALSIWDGDLRPLDHLAYRLPIGDVGDVDCPSLASQSLTAGWATILNAATADPSASPAPAVAGLHVFEIDSRTAIAVFVASGGLGQNADFLYWQLPQPLSQYLDGSFPADIKNTQDAAVGNQEGNADAYGPIAQKLRDLIFNAAAKRYFPTEKEYKRHVAAAKSALGRLQSLAEPVTQRTPLVFAKYVKQTDEGLIPAVLPLRLLAAGGEVAPLPGPILVVQPLPFRERIASGRSCVSTWALSLPQVVIGDIPEEVQRAIALPGSTVDAIITEIGGVGGLKTYFQREPSTANQPEAILLAAHQEGGALFYNQTDIRLEAGQLQRDYPAGSAAILAACETASVDTANSRIVDQLNILGVDLIVASPVQVRTSFAGRTSFELARLIAAPSEMEIMTPKGIDHLGEPPFKIVEIFDKAAEVAAHHLGKSYADMRFEFEFLGDYGVEFCPPTTGTDP